ncbi:MAG: HEPN domain-containing protein [Oscillospiraceae bacterium]|nr:HEPN domain-containing protein [Oscillospiraceae bacterium]
MNVRINKNSELFFKSLEDIWAAEQIWYGSPNIAVWLCTQAVEKTMKGFLHFHNISYDHGHQLRPLLDSVEEIVLVSPDFKKNVMYLNVFGSGLRYKNMTSDPTPEEAKLAIARSMYVVEEISSHESVKKFMDEAKEVHAKMLKINRKATQDGA